jgi:hypothetical protein
MEHMNRKFPKGNNLLRDHKESTLEKTEAKRKNKKNPLELTVDSKDDILDKKANQRMKRKAMLHAAMNKIHDPDFLQ